MSPSSRDQVSYTTAKDIGCASTQVLVNTEDGDTLCIIIKFCLLCKLEISIYGRPKGIFSIFLSAQRAITVPEKIMTFFHQIDSLDL